MEEEKDSLNLWQPTDSDYVKNIKWLQENFPSKTRVSSILILSDNVLDPTVIKSTFLLLQEIQKIKLNDTQGPIWEKICRRNPLTANCMELSVLEAFWKLGHQYDNERIENLSTLHEVIDAIDTARDKDIFDPFRYLGSVQVQQSLVNFPVHKTRPHQQSQRNITRKILRAKAMLMNFVAVIEDEDDKWANEEFERQLVKTVNNFNFPEGTTAYPFTLRSVGDLIGGNVVSDLNTLAAGYVLIFIYVLVNLGKLNSIEQRAWLSVAGIATVLMGVATSFGLAAHMGVFYSKMNQILPFLMLGVGIDDMFVIMQAFDNLSTDEKKLTLAKQLGRTMKHAGVAITITSVTDLLAFAIGATTVLPALSGFCIYASLGIFFIYFYAITFFLAWFSIDQRRVESSRDACICLKKENWSPNRCSQISLLNVAFEQLSKILVSKSAKITVIITTLGILAGGIYGAVTLDTFFDPNTFLDKGTYLRDYLEYKEIHFPEDGYTGQGSKIYFTDLDYVADMERIADLLNGMEQLASSQKNTITISPNSIDFWFTDFIKFVNTERSEEFGSKTLPTNKEYNNKLFQKDLPKFLQSVGARFGQDIELDNISPKILLSSMSYRHPSFEHSNEGIKAMKEVFALVEKYQFSGNVFATSEAYGTYLTTDIITSELTRNMLMALGVVFMCTLILIAHFVTSAIVLLTVTLTIINVAGYANFWGLNIDTLFAIFMTISIGLCVDYSAHIAHAFMVAKGSRDDRMKQTLTSIGPAVLNGGISTFLAFVLLSMSKSIIFLTFFKIFFLVVVFGLFHGLLFLPVVLSLFGPQSMENHGFARTSATQLRSSGSPGSSPSSAEGH